jgi:hypothetical protein
MKKRPTKENIMHYKKYRNVLNWTLRKAERQYYLNFIETNKNNSKKTWGIIKQIINKRQSSSYPEYFVINNKEISNNSDIANSFNKFFVNVGPQLSKKIRKTNVSPTSYISRTIQECIFLKPVTDNEVCKIMKSLKESSAGYDDICPKVVKKVYKSILNPLTHLLNLSISSGIFPNVLKIAKIIPLFKSGDSQSLNNYRPVSVLSVFSKVLERIMYDRLENFIIKHNILYDYQFGFRKIHSTSLALNVLTEKIQNSFNDKNITLGVFLDFSKAFDTVDHSILLHKLESYGIRGLALSWFRSYLTNRLQYVSYQNENSHHEKVITGVPQGSVLGPLLFLIYINDLPNVCNRLFPVLFADDSNMFISGKNVEELIAIMNTELAAIVEWLHTNRLSINIKKCHFMFFSPHDVLHDSNVKISDVNIDEVYHTKFLGVTIDNKLSWKNHITYIKSKISKGLGILYRARRFLDNKSLKTLYYSFIYPYLVYCIELWGFTFKTYLEPLYLIQKKIVRIITCSEYLANTDLLFKGLEILSVYKLSIFRVCIFLYKYKNNQVPRIFTNYFLRNADIHSYSTRESSHMRNILPRTEQVKRSFKYNAVNIYNGFVKIAKYDAKPSQFKRTIKHHLLFKYVL